MKVARNIQFGNFELPPEVATNHFLFAGTTGSGKTTLLRLLMQSTLAEIGTGRDTRAMVYDAKQDIVPLLAALAPDARIVISHPLDERGVAWDVHHDIREPQVAIEFAFNLIPHQPESQPFFTDASRHLVFGVVTSFMLSGVEWTLGDLIRVLKSKRLLKAILKKHPETRELVALYLCEDRLAANILSTVATKLLPFGPLVAAWDHARERISLQTWSESEMIWVLGNSEISRTSLQTLNRCMFKRASDLTLNQSESATRRNWFIVDELADISRLEGLVSLAKKGRSKGSCLALAFQSLAGLRDQHMYGPHATEEVLAQFGHKAIGRLECATSAEWASLLVGDQEIEQVSRSTTTARQGDSKTVNHQMVVRRAMLPSEFMDFEPCNVTNGLTAVFFIPSAGVSPETLDGPKLFRQWLTPPRDDVPTFVPRPIDCQNLRPWSDERHQYFGVPLKPERQPQREAANQRRPAKDLDDLFQ